MKNENWDVEAEAIKFIYTDELEVEVDGVVMSLDSFLKSTNGEIYENKTLLEQAMETRPYNADDLPRVRIIADKGIVTMINDEFEVTISSSLQETFFVGSLTSSILVSFMGQQNE